MQTLLDRFAGFLPSLHTLLIVAPLALLYGFAAATLASALRRRGTRVPYTRKVFHFSIFTMATVVQLAWGLPGVTVFGSVIAAIVSVAAFRRDGNPLFDALARPSDAPHGRLFILVPLLTTAVGGGVSNLLFPGYAYIGYLVCGWGDAVGEPVGTRWGAHKYRVPSMGGVPAVRSVEGSGAVFLVGSLAALLGLLAFGRPPVEALWLALAAGLAGAVVEAVSTHGLDNFTVQVAASAVAWWLGA